MNQVETAAGLQWDWRQPAALKRFHELTCGGDVIGTLQFAGGCGSLATAESAYGSWTFKRAGFLSPRITVRKVDESGELAVFVPKWTGGGELHMTGGESYKLKCLSFWGGDWAFENQRGEALLSLHGPHGFLKNHGEIVVNAAVDSATLTLLAALAWYVRLLMNEDAVMTSVIIS